MKKWIVVCTFVVVCTILIFTCARYLLPSEQEQLFAELHLDKQLVDEMKIEAVTRRRVSWGEGEFPYSMKIEAFMNISPEEARRRFHASIIKGKGEFEGYELRYGRFAELMTCSDRSDIPEAESQAEGGKLLGQGGFFYAELNSVKNCFCWSIPERQWIELSRQNECAYLYPMNSDRAVYLFSGDVRRYDAREVILNFLPEPGGHTTVVITASRDFFVGFKRLFYRKS